MKRRHCCWSGIEIGQKIRLLEGLGRDFGSRMQTFAAMSAEGELKTGYADSSRMAIPISVGTVLQFFVLLTDNFSLARLSEKAINGAGNAGLVYMTLEMIAAVVQQPCKSSSRGAQVSI